MYNFS